MPWKNIYIRIKNASNIIPEITKCRSTYFPRNYMNFHKTAIFIWNLKNTPQSGYSNVGNIITDQSQ